MSSSELKMKAKELLMGKKKNAAIMVLVMGLIMGVVSLILGSIFSDKIVNAGFGITYKVQNPIAAILNAVISIFFLLGAISYFMRIARGEEPELKELFSKGSIFLKVLVSSILAGLLITLGSILFVIPGIILAFAYSMIEYIYIDNPDIGITEVMKKSREMMKGHKWQLFCLELSFIGWIILTPFTLGILLFWLTPYMGVTTVLFYDSIKE